MGLLSRAGRKVTNFVDGAMTRMSQRADPLNYTSDRFAPVASAVYGGLGGAGIGAAANPNDPLAGAATGAAMGAAGGAGLSFARQGAAGVMGGMRNMANLGDSNPQEVAEAVRALATREGPEAAQAALTSIQRARPELFEQVMMFLS